MRIFLELRQLALIMTWATLATVALGQPPVFQAGAATTNITPPLGEMIVGGWTPLPADEVHDELHAKCIVLDDGQDKVAMVICDNVGIPREVFDRAKRLIEEKTGIPSSHQLMAATHTHSATTARGNNAMVADNELTAYQVFLSDRIVDAVRIANKRLIPAEIGWGSVDESSQLFNRRWFVTEEEQRRNPFGGVDQVRMNPGNSTLIRQAGPVDPEVSILSLRAKDGQPIAVLANYSLHYVGGVPNRVVSADYFAVFANYLGELMQTNAQYPPFVGIMSNGTSGDVNNINFRDRGPRKEPFEKMREVGELLARRVDDALNSIEHQSWVDIAAASSELQLEVRKPDAKLLSYMQTVVQRGDQEEPYHPHEKTYAARLQTLAESPDQVDVPLQVIKIGKLGIAAIPFEVFTEIGLEIKDRCPWDDAFTIELANGSYGYLPTPAQHALGGYETWLGTNKVEIEASTKIVERLMQMFDKL
ncbi:MAG: neutral/alkaline non-lysosomal ceramidase N-terminal domain-containing protein [Pirellulaceae bacterium]